MMGNLVSGVQAIEAAGVTWSRHEGTQGLAGVGVWSITCSPRSCPGGSRMGVVPDGDRGAVTV